MQVQGRVGGARHGGHRLGDHRAVGAAGRQEAAASQAAGRRAGLHHVLHRRKLPGLRRGAQPRLQQRLLRVPRRGALRRPVLLLPRRPPGPAQRHQLPHLRPQPGRVLGLGLEDRLRGLGRGARRAADAAAARPPDAPVLRGGRQRRLRRRGAPQDPAPRLGRPEGRRRHPRFRDEPDGAREPGVPRRGGGAGQEAGRAAQGGHGPVRLLLQLDVAADGRGPRRGCAGAGRALRGVRAATAAAQELRD
ncbi:Aspartic proteinase nepenthesin-2 [Zea mays]|uniref:Aspartic proteinase nepenthesin-2 n=1 Tax=Zea mays TaxID=4577 RepID=B4FFM8_MAIZE|nr:unknown [Zea mays]ACR35212.1 unknown [Zea mays]AQK97343.1 Aspartic proteinase nepenthesin-2 [Zea mays]AQK97345.1 Aspartic proteinase nepenthesin-2 [Zea mays]